MRGKNI